MIYGVLVAVDCIGRRHFSVPTPNSNESPSVQHHRAGIFVDIIQSTCTVLYIQYVQYAQQQCKYDAHRSGAHIS